MRQRRPRTVAHLKTCLQEEWDKITPETLHHLVSSVPKRLLSVVKGMATLQSGKCFTVPTFFGMCCRSEWQERMYIYKWHEVDQTKHEIFCVHIVCNEIQVKVNLESTTFFFYLRFPYCPNFFWFGVVFMSSFSETADASVWVVNKPARLRYTLTQRQAEVIFK